MLFQSHSAPLIFLSHIVIAKFQARCSFLFHLHFPPLYAHTHTDTEQQRSEDVQVQHMQAYTSIFSCSPGYLIYLMLSLVSPHMQISEQEVTLCLN